MLRHNPGRSFYRNLLRRFTLNDPEGHIAILHRYQPRLVAKRDPCTRIQNCPIQFLFWQFAANLREGGPNINTLIAHLVASCAGHRLPQKHLCAIGHIALALGKFRYRRQRLGVLSEGQRQNLSSLHLDRRPAHHAQRHAGSDFRALGQFARLGQCEKPFCTLLKMCQSPDSLLAHIVMDLRVRHQRGE